MKYAVIDVETNGIPDYKLPADHPSQPRLASIGIVMVEATSKPDGIAIQAEHEFLVKPDGWKMTAEAGAINGLTDARLEAEGLDVRDILGKYATLVESGYVIVAYGAQHDCKVLRGEFRRAGLPDRFDITKNVCLMRAVQPLKIPKANGKGGWPQLDDVLRHLGQKAEPKPHSALVGARSAFAVFAAFLNKGILPEPSVHYAKNAPLKANGEKSEPPAPKVAAKAGDRKTQNGVELEYDGNQWLPVMNARNYPNLAGRVFDTTEDIVKKGGA